ARGGVRGLLWTHRRTFLHRLDSLWAAGGGSAVGPSGVALGQVAPTVLGIEDGMELAEAALRLERILTGVGVEHPGHLVGEVLGLPHAFGRGLRIPGQSIGVGVLERADQ